MVMPLAGTFYYTGVVPATQAERESGLWRMKQQRDPPSQLELDSHKFWQIWQRDSVRQAAADHLRDARLVGFEPTLRISGIRLILEAHSRHLSQLRSASLELDAALIETFEAGDLLTLVRTPTADIAVGVERGWRTDDRCLHSGPMAPHRNLG
jgi:hypothetical protein